MPMLDDLARYHEAQRTHEWKFQWWDRKDALVILEGLLGQLKEAGETATLRCHRGISEKGSEVVWLTVYEGQSRSHHEGFNQSHPCPPICPDE